MSYMDDVTYDKTCVVCDEGFEADHSRSKYCSDQCKEKKKEAERLERRTKNCSYRHCQKEFVDESKQNSRKYCYSDESCSRKEKIYREEHENNPDEDPPYPPPEELFLDDQIRECEYCEEEYTPTDSSQVYCSDECRRVQELLTDAPPELQKFNPYVTCQECGEEFVGAIPNSSGKEGSYNHFQDEHNMTQKEYREKYPNSYRLSELSRKKSGKNQRGQKVDEEGRKRMRESQKEYYEDNEVWNKGLTKEDHPGIMRQAKQKKEDYKGEGNPFYGKEHTEDSKEKMRKSSVRNWEDLEYRKKTLMSSKKSIKSGKHVSKFIAFLFRPWLKLAYGKSISLTMRFFSN